MSSDVKTELALIGILVLVLGLGFGYITHRSNGENTSTAGATIVVEPSLRGALSQTLNGRDLPMIHSQDIVTGKSRETRFDSMSVVVPLSGNSCLQKQVSDLRRIQALKDSVGDSVPVHAIFFGDQTEESMRYQILLARKAVRPTFELWYVNQEDSLESFFREETSSLVLLVKDQEIASVFHPTDHGGILNRVSEPE